MNALPKELGLCIHCGSQFPEILTKTAQLISAWRLRRRENVERTKECDELSARVERVSAELAETQRRAETVSAEAARADVRLRSADAQKASLAAEVRVNPKP